MSPHDTLRDRLADAAAPTARPLPNPRQLRARAVRHRNRRRALAGGAVVVAVTAIAVAGSTLLGPRTASLGPATQPPPVTTEATAPPTPDTSVDTPTTAAPPPTSVPTAPAAPPLEQDEAQAFVESFRFADEAAWQADPDLDIFPVEVDLGVTTLLAHGCEWESVDAEGVLAARRVVKSGVESGSVRQISVFADDESAAAAFAGLRAQMRACHAEVPARDYSGNTVQPRYVGEQLALGDESFWVGTQDLVVGGDGPFSVGDELFYSTAAVLVLDGNVITVIDDPASSDEMRATFVEEASAEWEGLRPAYDEVRR